MSFVLVLHNSTSGWCVAYFWSGIPVLNAFGVWRSRLAHPICYSCSYHEVVVLPIVHLNCHVVSHDVAQARLEGNVGEKLEYL
jgi:hypothetical protein